MLQIQDINVYYGAIHAIKGISFHVNQGEVVTLIGANGAGKTTILNTISGLLRTKTGDVSFLGNSIKSADAHKIVRSGLAHVPEGRRVFASLSVMDNLEMGAFTRRETISQLNDELDAVFQRFPRLKERRRQSAGTLSGGEQQMLAMGRALMSKPKLLMLDEPSMGLAPLLVEEIFSIISALKQEGVTILLIEQNANMALSVADRGYVLENGHIVLENAASVLMNDEVVKQAYLGG